MPCYFSPHAYRFTDTIPLLKLLVALVFATLQKLSTCADFLCPQAVIQGDLLLKEIFKERCNLHTCQNEGFLRAKTEGASPPLPAQILWSTNGLMKPVCGKPAGYCCHCLCAFTVLASRTQCSPCSRILLQRSL